MSGLVDQHGRPLQASNASRAREEVLRGGWVEATGDLSKPVTSLSQVMGLPINRDVERTAARVAFLTNPLIAGAIEVIHGFVIGDGITYGDMPDKTAYAQLEEFWAANELDNLASTYLYQWLVDGENLTLFPKQHTRSRAGRNEPARIGLYEVSNQVILEPVPGLPHVIEQVMTEDDIIRDRNEFIWQAHNALWNDPRGWPVIMQAVPAALSYISFANSRIRLHQFQSRLNGIYKTFIHATSPEAALKEQKDRSAAFGRIPRDGGVLTIGKNPQSGQAEEFEFLSPDARAQDSKSDAQMLFRIFCTAIGLPEHYLGITGEVTRTTAASMDRPTVNSLARFQATVRSWLDQVMRRELIRRNGPAKRYKVVDRELKGGRTVTFSRFVPAEVVYFPWAFPELQAEDLEQVLQKVQLVSAQALASRQTMQQLLGLDAAEENERMAAEGLPQADAPPPDPEDPEE